jgi:hypothetical protein
MLERFESVDYDFAGLMVDYVGADLFGFRKEPTE